MMAAPFSAAAAGLALRRDFLDEPDAYKAYGTLMRDVFDVDILARDRLCGRVADCRPFAFFDAEGACVASAEVFALPLRLDGTRCTAAAIRLVAVAPLWRGRGLFRSLMDELLAWCDAAGPRWALLYAASPALYQPFGFAPAAQHKRAGPPPARATRDKTAARATRRLDPGHPDDAALLHRLLATRTAVSDQVAVEGGATLFLSSAAERILDYSPALDALIVSDADSDAARFILIDLVAEAIPSLAAVLAATNTTPARVEVLFPTDKLDWHGEAEDDETGLMVRGPRPAAFARPFMLPPTTEF